MAARWSATRDVYKRQAQRKAGQGCVAQAAVHVEFDQKFPAVHGASAKDADGTQALAALGALAFEGE